MVTELIESLISVQPKPREKITHLVHVQAHLKQWVNDRESMMLSETVPTATISDAIPLLYKKQNITTVLELRRKPMKEQKWKNLSCS